MSEHPMSGKNQYKLNTHCTVNSRLTIKKMNHGFTIVKIKFYWQIVDLLCLEFTK